MSDRDSRGVLWLLKDYREDWPERMAVTEPPVCLPCVRLSGRLCPALRTGAAAVRVRRAPVSGVHGTFVRELRGCTIAELAELCRS